MLRGAKRSKKNHEIYDLLVVVNYYHPHVSGLSRVAQIYSEELASLGKKVAVSTVSHNLALPKSQKTNGVLINRSSSLVKLSRARLSISFLWRTAKMSRKSRAVFLHLPLPGAGIMSTLIRKPIVTYYHCDAPNVSPTQKLIASVLDRSHRRCLLNSRIVIFSTEDYFNFSRMKNIFDDFNKVRFISPPVNSKYQFSKKPRSNQEGRNFGFVGRFTSEKGLAILLNSFIGHARRKDTLTLAGPSTLSGDSVMSLVLSACEKDNRIRLVLDGNDEQIDELISNFDILCLPSTNSYEAFGLVQVEALMKGVGVCVSDLPGVRVPALYSKMGRVISVHDQRSWEELFANYKPSNPDRLEIQKIQKRFGREQSVANFLQVLEEVEASNNV